MKEKHMSTTARTVMYMSEKGKLELESFKKFGRCLFTIQERFLDDNGNMMITIDVMFNQSYSKDVSDFFNKLRKQGLIGKTHYNTDDHAI